LELVRSEETPDGRWIGLGTVAESERQTS
jgi:hypothetical protein